MKNKVQLIHLAIAFLFVLSGCAALRPAQVERDPGILRVGITPDAPPLIYKQNGTITGLEADMAVKLAGHLNKTVIFVEVPWMEQISALLDNRTDIIMSGMSITAARQVEIAFSKPYFKSGQVILTKKLHNANFITTQGAVLAQSITWRMGVVKGTTGEFLVRDKNIGFKSIRTYDDQEKALSALMAGRIDVFINDAPTALTLAARHRSKGITPLPVMLGEEYLAWGLRKNDTDLIEAVNTFIDQIGQDGTLGATVKQWIPLAR